ncbi:MAG: OmpA family protein, partial [Myxococcales bacterium]|nr:OmpA family protein [Myxococcales bacterium]
YLTDDVDAWLAHYGADRPWHQRWGTREDQLMIQSLAEEALGSASAMGQPPVRWFQEWHNALPADRRSSSHETLTPDGAIGPHTRRQLVADYMNRDGTTLPDDVTLTVHGCGESFPLADGAEDEIEPTPAGPDSDAKDRRVELYFFDRVLGVEPPPPGEISAPGSPQYPEWRARARHTHDLRLGAGGQAAIRPVSWFGYRKSFPKPSLFGAIRRAAQHLEEHPLAHLVIVGHTDTLGSDGDNHALSLARAEAVREILTGDVEALMARFDTPDPHEPWSWEELQWLLHGVRVASAPAYVGEADGVLGPATQLALGAFQMSERDLEITYDSDRATVERLVERYIEAALGDVTRPSETRVEAVGGGHWSLPRPFGPLPADYDPEEDLVEPFGSDGYRRVELFLFDVAPSPPAEEFPTAPGGSDVYDRWCDAVDDELEPADWPCWVQVVASDYVPRSVSVGLERLDAASGSGGLSTDARGYGRGLVPRGYYRASVSGGQGPEAHYVHHQPDERCGSLIVVSLADAAGIAPAGESA